MPPKKSRSTGALRIALITSSGVALAAAKPSAGRAAHLLVVVAGRAAGREGVVEPEAVLPRDGVGEVGERGRALVGGDNEIGIVVVMAHDVVGRDNLLVGEVVGDVEQGGDEKL